MSELLLTCSIDPIEEGQVFSESLPRHVTIWQYFQLSDFHMEEFIEDTTKVVEAFTPIEIVGGEEAKFGPKEDVKVRLIESLGHGATVKALHTMTGIGIQRFGATVQNPEWSFEGYNPHMTYVDGRALEKDEREILTTLELIERAPGTRNKIVRKIWELEEA